MMIAAFWANSAIESKDRTAAIENIERNFDEAVVMIHSPPQEDEELDKNNPFLQAAKRGVAKLDTPVAPDATVKEVIDYTADIDQ